MKIKELEKKNLFYKAEITLPAADIDKAVDVQLSLHGKSYKLPGFRPGKVPHHILKANLGRAVMGEVLETVVNQNVQKALSDNKLKPALQPKIEVKSFEEGKDLVFTIDVELLPEFKLADLKSIALEKPIAKAGEEMIQTALKGLSERHGEQKTLTEARASKDGDILIIDFDGKTEAGEAYPGMSAQDFSLALGSGNMIPGFEEQLKGKKAGAKTDVKVTFPEDYGMEALAGKPAIFSVTVKEIRELIPAALDDALAQKLGLKDFTQLQTIIVEQIEKDYTQMTRMKLKRALLDALDDTHQFDVPEGMVDLEYNSILHQMEHEGHHHGPNEACDHGKNLSDEEKEDLKEISNRRVRLGLVLSQIGQEHKLSVSDAELQQAIIAQTRNYPGQERQVLDFYRKNPRAIESLRAPMFEEKVIDFILSQVTVKEKEVTPEELAAEDDAPKAKAAKKAKSNKPKAAKAEKA